MLASYTYAGFGCRTLLARGDGVHTTYTDDAVSKLTSVAFTSPQLASTNEAEPLTFAYGEPDHPVQWRPAYVWNGLSTSKYADRIPIDADPVPPASRRAFAPQLWPAPGR
jgi:hypothetical protein